MARLVPMSACCRDCLRSSSTNGARGGRRTAMPWQQRTCGSDRRSTVAMPSPMRVLDADGTLLAIGEPAAGGLLQPVVVLV